MTVFVIKKKYLVLLVIGLFFFNQYAWAQDFVKEYTQLGTLMSQGKFKETLLVIDHLIEIGTKQNKKEANKDSDYLISLKATIYENIGNYAKAEQLYKSLLAKAPITESDSLHTRRNLLHSLSSLYEKMGNVPATARILEEMVITANGHNKVADKRSNYIDFYMNATKLNYKEQGISMDIADSLTLIKQIEENFDNLDTANIDPRSMAVLDAIIQLQATSHNRPPSIEQINLLRQGKLTLGGSRNGLNFNDPWSEVKRLFKCYMITNNTIAAEALIKQAIAIDDNPETNDNPMNNMLNSIMPKEVLDHLAKKTSDAVANNMRQLLRVNDKYSGTDIFYIQNKDLLAQLYQHTGRIEQFKLLADTISLLCKKLENVSNPLVLSAISEVYTHIGENDRALENYQKIINIYNNPVKEKFVNFIQYQTALKESASLYKAKGDYGKAKLLLDEALAYDKKIASEKYASHMIRLLAMAQWHEDTGDLIGATRYCSNILKPVMEDIRQNFSFLSESEKRFLLKNQTDFFDFSVSLLLTDPHLSEEFSLQTFNRQMELKGIVLNDEKRILVQLRRGGDLHLKQLLDNWQFSRAAIAWKYSQPPSLLIARQLDSLKEIANDQEKEISRLSSSFANYLNNQTDDYQHLVKYLKPGTAAIEFVRFKYYHKNWTDSVYYGAFILLPNFSSPKFIPLCEEKELVKILGADIISSKTYIDQIYGNGIQPKNNTIADRKSDFLYDKLWKPLTPYLSGINEVSLSPTGLLNRINFNALPYNKNEYLIDRYEIKLYDNLKQLSSSKPIIKDINGVFFGNIDYDTVKEGNHWPALDTKEEVQASANLLLGANYKAEVFTESQATEERLKQFSGDSPGIIHIASHGFSKPPQKSFFVTDDPMMRTGIVLAGANKVWSGQEPIPDQEDGIVSSYEIASLDFSNTQLVIMSSCETALGDIIDNEGVFGMQRAFKLAGASSLVLGLWNLENEKTTELLTDFYKNIISVPKLNYSQAFNQAQKQLRQKQSPYYWAGLVFIE